VNKLEFIGKLRGKLIDLPYEEVRERLNFYSEMISDRMEDGLTEDDAIAQIGSVDAIASEIRSEFLSGKKVGVAAKEKRHRRVWVGVLIGLGSPLWLSLMIAALAVILSLYAVLWSVVAALWSAVLALAVAGVAAIPGALIFAIKGNPLAALGFLGMGAFSAGLAVFAFYGVLFATKWAAFITKNAFLWIKNKFRR